MEWNGGMNSGMTTPIERSVPDDFYPISDDGVARGSEIIWRV